MNLIRLVSMVATVSLIATFSLCASEKSTSQKAAEPAQKQIQQITTDNKSPEKTILFFMNPNGNPCQIQLSIINGMKEKLDGKATVTYIKTTEPNDMNKFYEYGIRGLPSLVIVNKDGKEIKRLPPGIQDENTILAAINN